MAPSAMAARMAGDEYLKRAATGSDASHREQAPPRELEPDREEQ
jgi:hypothetical protein